jgi:hypothetical protein
MVMSHQESGCQLEAHRQLPVDSELTSGCKPVMDEPAGVPLARAGACSDILLTIPPTSPFWAACDRISSQTISQTWNSCQVVDAIAATPPTTPTTVPTLYTNSKPRFRPSLRPLSIWPGIPLSPVVDIESDRPDRSIVHGLEAEALDSDRRWIGNSDLSLPRAELCLTTE